MSFQWTTSFKLLGIQYDVDLGKIISLNYDKTLVKMMQDSLSLTNEYESFNWTMYNVYANHIYTVIYPLTKPFIYIYILSINCNSQSCCTYNDLMSLKTENKLLKTKQNKQTKTLSTSCHSSWSG